MKYLIRKEDKWLLTETVKDKYADNVVEIRQDELFIIFTFDKMQVFTAEKERERLDINYIENNYSFGGKVFGKVDDIFVYKKKGV